MPSASSECLHADAGPSTYAPTHTPLVSLQGGRLGLRVRTFQSARLSPPRGKAHISSRDAAHTVMAPGRPVHRERPWGAQA